MTGAARIAVERRGATSFIAELASCDPVGLRPLPPNGALARVALVQTSACLVAGDDVATEVRVGPGASLEIVELSATMAHPVPATRPGIRQVATVEVGAGGRLLWLAQPLVLAASTRLYRRLDVVVADGARALLRDIVVFGRSGERPGAATTRVRITRDGRAVLDDAVATADPAVLRSPAVAGSARVLASLTLVGVEAPEPPATGALSLGAQDTTLRCLGPEAVGVRARLATVEGAWRRALLEAGVSGLTPRRVPRRRLASQARPAP